MSKFNETQPAELWRLPGVKAKTGLSRAAIYQLIQQNKFPSQIKIGRSSCWDSRAVQAWINATIEKAGAK